MKRGFLNTARSKRVIEEAYAPQSPPNGRRNPPERPNPSPAQKSSQTQPGDKDSNDAATALKDDAMDVDPAETPVATVLQEVYADGHVVAVRVTRSTDSEREAADPSMPPRRAQDGGEEVANVQDATDIEETGLQDVYADGRVVGVRVVRYTAGEEKTLPESLEDDHSTKAETHHAAKDPKDKGKEKVVNVDDDEIMNPSRPDDRIIFHSQRALRRNPPGWGRHPDEEFFHTAPPAAYGIRHEKRAVFRVWPRDPNGKAIHPNEDHRGTLSPDGYPWAATLYDIFYVSGAPDVPSFMSIATGSAICEAVEAVGELDAAAREIEWAKSESKPRVEGAASTEELIKCLDRKRHLFLNAQEEMKRKQGGGQEEEDATEQAPTKDGEGDDDPKPVFTPSPSSKSVASSFHPNHDSQRWSFTPFESQHESSILLQERIPFYLLPQSLYVHDPFCLLIARQRRFDDTSWTSRPDIIRTYNLHLSETARQECEDKRQKAEELEEFKARTLIVLRYQRTKKQIENCEPVIEVPLPPYPRRLTKIEESHLYLSPVAKVGKGHHSILYKGEWELPRDMFVKERICSLCFEESVDKEVQRLKDTGRWGTKGFTGRQPTQAELDDPPKLEMDGEIIDSDREITCVVCPNANPSTIVEMVDQTGIWDVLMERRNIRAALLYFTGDDDEDKPESMKDSNVPVFRMNPPFSYESQKPCTHDSIRAPVPRTAIFTVVAKLSFKGDPHLDREANNYQMFPEHFFEHYDGYIVISQLHSIVPVNAVVPQFYGYYVPETPKTKGETPEEPPYLSPILLLEHCGEPINPWELSDEDQEECVSLLLRFQRAGWLHESVAARNFLVQRGKPTEFPLVRESKPELSFRLIDFGRSRKYDSTHEKRTEETEAQEVFRMSSDRTAITLGGVI